MNAMELPTEKATEKSRRRTSDVYHEVPSSEHSTTLAYNLNRLSIDYHQTLKSRRGAEDRYMSYHLSSRYHSPDSDWPRGSCEYPVFRRPVKSFM